MLDLYANLRVGVSLTSPCAGTIPAKFSKSQEHRNHGLSIAQAFIFPTQRSGHYSPQEAKERPGLRSQLFVAYRRPKTMECTWPPGPAARNALRAGAKSHRPNRHAQSCTPVSTCAIAIAQTGNGLKMHSFLFTIDLVDNLCLVTSS